MIHEFRVRWYQRAFHEALVNRTHDRLMAVWHRRAGKDEVALHAERDLMLRDPGTYWHCFPEQKQARKAIWNGVDGRTGRRRIFQVFPERIIVRMQDDDMFLEIQNGATFQLIGSDRYDATVGSGPKGITYSEWALSNPAAWAYHSPMIRESKGFAAFITTPRGNNHAKQMFDTAKRSPNWFAELLTAEQTGALTADQLAEALAEYQDLHGSDLGRAIFEQEYLCSWSGAMVGAYFGAEMARCERDGRVQPVEIDRTQPVHTAWDLGKAVNNPIWCFQVIGNALRIVDFYVPDSDDLADWCAWLDGQGYHGDDWVPHDVLHPVWGSKRTRLDVLKDKGRKPRMWSVAALPLAEGLQAGRQAINAATFHGGDDERAKRVAHGVEGLKAYRREWDDERKTFRETPLKDWAEHIGSAWRHLGFAWREAKPVKIEPPKPDRLEYRVGPNGLVQGNMSVREAVEAMVRRKQREA